MRKSLSQLAYRVSSLSSQLQQQQVPTRLGVQCSSIWPCSSLHVSSVRHGQQPSPEGVSIPSLARLCSSASCGSPTT